MIAAILLVFLQLLLTSCQPNFIYHDTSLYVVNSYPRVIVDRLNVPPYLLTYEPGNSMLQVWRYPTLQLINTLYRQEPVGWAISNNGSEIAVANASQITYFNMQGNVVDYQLRSIYATSNYNRYVFTMNPTVMVAKLADTLVQVFGVSSNNQLYVRQIISTNYSSQSGNFCSNGSRLLTLTWGMAVVYTRNTPTLNYSQLFRSTLNGASTSVMSSSDDCSLLVRANSNDGIEIAVNFEARYLVLPQLFVGNEVDQVKVNFDGSAIAAVLSDGSIKQYQKSGQYNSSAVGTSSNCQWYYTACIYNCSQVKGSTATGMDTACSCQSPLSWSGGACQRDCSSDPNAVAVSSIDPTICVCSSNFVWNSQLNLCAIDCSNAQSTSSDGLSCVCATNYYWSSGQCQINCSSFSNSKGTSTSKDSCLCNSSYFWQNPTEGCVINCSMSFATHRTSSTSCGCQDHYAWDANACKVNCSAVPGANPGLYASCTCGTGYSYNNSAFSCQIDCPTTSGYSGSRVSDSQCACASGYTWSNGECKKTVSLGMIIGIAVPAGLALIGLVVFLSWCCCCRTVAPPIPYYGRDPRGYPNAYPLNNSGAAMSAQHLNFRPALPNPANPAGFANMGKRSTINEVLCSICLLSDTNCITSCRHRFHRECIQLWLMKDRSCPNCRAPNIMIV